MLKHPRHLIRDTALYEPLMYTNSVVGVREGFEGRGRRSPRSCPFCLKTSSTSQSRTESTIPWMTLARACSFTRSIASSGKISFPTTRRVRSLSFSRVSCTVVPIRYTGTMKWIWRESASLIYSSNSDQTMENQFTAPILPVLLVFSPIIS